MFKKIIVHTDGASRGNPGWASIAYVIEGVTEEPIDFHHAIGQTTNNQAEYRAMLAALNRLLSLEAKNSEIEIYSDSELMVRQIIGQYRVKDLNLKPLFTEIQTLVAKLKLAGNSLIFKAVRRGENKRADELANLALDQE
jgi:ribonuclease HI